MREWLLVLMAREIWRVLTSPAEGYHRLARSGARWSFASLAFLPFGFTEGPNPGAFVGLVGCQAIGAVYALVAMKWQDRAWKREQYLRDVAWLKREVESALRFSRSKAIGARAALPPSEDRRA